MLKEKDTQQTLLPEDSHANLSLLQEKEKEQMMIATSGMKLLESLPNVNRGGLLEKMLKDLLTSTTAWSSDRCKMIWKSKVSKSNVLLFQLQASVRGIKGKESGLWLTPTATEMGARSEEALQKRKEYRKSIGRSTTPPGNLAEQVHYGMATTNMYPTPTSVQRPNEGNMRMMRKQVLQGNISKEEASAMVGKDVFKAHGKVKMYPTPTASDIEGGAAKDVQMKNGRFFRENKKGERWGVKLRDAMEKMYNTPTTNDYKNLTFPKSQMKRAGSLAKDVMTSQNLKPGGKLNPNFVEFLMGYPMNWTKIEPTE